MGPPPLHRLHGVLGAQHLLARHHQRWIDRDISFSLLSLLLLLIVSIKYK
jgi:hypothetical protein